MCSNQQRRILMTFVGTLLLASQAVAHPGHGLGGGSTHWLHYATDPLHVVPIVGGVLALVFALRAFRSARARKR